MHVQKRSPAKAVDTSLGTLPVRQQEPMEVAPINKVTLDLERYEASAYAASANPGEMWKVLP
jgi:hypothetical protein